MNYNTEINRALQQFGIKSQTAIEVYGDEEFSADVQKHFEDKCCALMDAVVRDDTSVVEILSAVQDVVGYVNDQYPPSSEYHEVLNMILEQSSLIADKISDAAMDEDAVNAGLFGATADTEDSVGETALTLSEQLTDTYQASVANDNFANFMKCSLSAVLLSVSDAMTSIGLLEADMLAKMNDDYVTAKAAMADFQKMVARIRTFFDTASANAKNADGTDASTGTSSTADWYAWFVNKDPIPWEDIPLPQDLLNDKTGMLKTFQDAIKLLTAQYRNIDGPGGKEFQNFLTKNNLTRDKWLRQSIQKVMEGCVNGSGSVNVYWSQEIGDNKTPTTFPIPIPNIKISDKMNLAFPFDPSFLPEIFKDCFAGATITDVLDKNGNPTGEKRQWLTKDKLILMEKELASRIQIIAPNKMVNDVLGYTNAFDDVSSFNGFNTWLDAPLKQLSAAQDALNQKLSAINERIRNIANTIKENLSKVSVMV